MIDRAGGIITPERLAEIKRLWEEDEVGFRVLRAAKLNDAEVQRLIDMHEEIRLLLAYSEKARQEEREACARLAESWPAECLSDPDSSCGGGIAVAILARR